MGFDFGISAFAARNREGRAERREERQLEIERHRQDTELQRRVIDARAAGLHPLFALGGSAGGGGGTMTIGGGEDPNFEGELAGAARDYIEDRARRSAERNAAVERGKDFELKDAQIESLRAEARRNDAIAMDHASSVMARGVQRANQGGDTPEIIYPRGQVNPPQRQTELFRTPIGEIRADKRFADAEEAERRYGDIAQEFFGISNAAADISSTINRNYRAVLDRALNPSYRIRDMKDWDNFGRYRASRVPQSFREGRFGSAGSIGGYTYGTSEGE